jgi:hypothetical protein
MGEVQTPVYQKKELLRSDSLAAGCASPIKMPNRMSDLRVGWSRIVLSAHGRIFIAFIAFAIISLTHFCEYAKRETAAELSWAPGGINSQLRPEFSRMNTSERASPRREN